MRSAIERRRALPRNGNAAHHLPHSSKSMDGIDPTYLVGLSTESLTTLLALKNQTVTPITVEWFVVASLRS